MSLNYKEFIKIPRFRYNKILTTIKPSDIHYLLLYDILLYFIISPCLYFIFMNIARKSKQHSPTSLDCVTGYDLFPVSAFRTYTFLIIQRHTT